jgi:hypothetical protein
MDACWIDILFAACCILPACCSVATSAHCSFQHCIFLFVDEICKGLVSFVASKIQRLPFGPTIKFEFGGASYLGIELNKEYFGS